MSLGNQARRCVIDLNADLGESYGAWRLGDDEALLSIVPTAAGGQVRVLARSVCLHGDTPGAVSLARSVRFRCSGQPQALRSRRGQLASSW